MPAWSLPSYPQLPLPVVSEKTKLLRHVAPPLSLLIHHLHKYKTPRRLTDEVRLSFIRVCINTDPMEGAHR